MNRISALICVIMALTISGCATFSGGSSTEDRRQAVLDMKNDVLAELYKLKPNVKAQIASAPGYAVFSNGNVNIIFASFGGGYGVVQDNRTGKHTFMKMGEVGVGLGLGIKDFRAVFVFNTAESMNRFVEHGWAVGAQADVAAKASDKGAAVSGEITVDNITIYQLTETGLALQATVKGTKYWKDDSLN